MKIALLGYGKMGKEIESLLADRGHQLSGIVSSSQSRDKLGECDVAIDFSKPDVVLDNIEHCLKKGIPLVVGTTGWNEHQETVQTWVNQYHGSLIHASNFSIGVYVFRQANKLIASALSGTPDYKAAVHEIHHTEKLDAPSGTAITVAEDMVAASDNLNGWSHDEETMEGTLPVSAERIENVKGTHRVTYTSEIDEISIEHKALSRRGFALGAIIAAEWIVHRKGMHGISEMINI